MDYKLAPTEFAQIIQDKKPYLLEVESKVQEVQNGRVLVELDVRSGRVDKMIFKELDKTWLREKSAQDIESRNTIIFNFIQSF